MTDISPGALYQYCIHEGCEWTSVWHGGSAYEDPAIDHLQRNQEHTVRSGAKHYHAVCCARQSHGESISEQDSDLIKSDILEQ